MLGVEYQHIYCKVKKCRFNEKHQVRDGKTNKVVQTYYTCEKSDIDIDKNGICTEVSNGTTSRMVRKRRFA